MTRPSFSSPHRSYSVKVYSNTACLRIRAIFSSLTSRLRLQVSRSRLERFVETESFWGSPKARKGECCSSARPALTNTVLRFSLLGLQDVADRFGPVQWARLNSVLRGHHGRRTPSS